MAGMAKRELISEKCEKCNGKGAPLFVPGEPTSGHDLSKTCDACGGQGFVRRIEQS